ncbi:MAG TPA: RnfABCDGE type electron transport complex subunit G [Clostridia bacterium]
MSEERRELAREEMHECVQAGSPEERLADMREETREEDLGAVLKEIGDEADESMREYNADAVGETSGEVQGIAGIEAQEETRGIKRVLSGIFSDEFREMMGTALRLFIICLVTALCLAVVNDITKDTIALRDQQTAEEQRMLVMSGADRFEKLEGWEDQEGKGLVKEVYAAYSGDVLIGYVFSAISSGYGGDIPVTVGVGKDGTITGIRIGDNEETPGLGSKVAGEKFTSQYAGKDISGEIKVVTKPVSADDEIQAVSGATISTRAVNSAVQASADLGARLLQQNGGGKK